MMSVAVALPLLIVTIAQVPDRTERLPQQPSAAVDLSASTPAPAVPAAVDNKAFDKLFAQALLSAQAADRRPSADDRATLPRVVCGMVVIPANPAVDPRIVILPRPQSADAKIRRIVPEACRE
jgi:hypothetical protein